MQDADARFAIATDLDDTLIADAPAGTGQTTALVTTTPRSPARPYAPANILAVRASCGRQ